MSLVSVTHLHIYLLSPIVESNIVECSSMDSKFGSDRRNDHNFSRYTGCFTRTLSSIPFLALPHALHLGKFRATLRKQRTQFVFISSSFFFRLPDELVRKKPSFTTLSNEFGPLTIPPNSWKSWSSVMQTIPALL